MNIKRMLTLMLAGVIVCTSLPFNTVTAHAAEPQELMIEETGSDDENITDIIEAPEIVIDDDGSEEDTEDIYIAESIPDDVYPDGSDAEYDVVPALGGSAETRELKNITFKTTA